MSADYRKETPAHGQDKFIETPLHAEAGYERIDAQAGATYRAGLYILGAMFAVAALVVPLYWFLARRETRTQPPASTVLRSEPPAGVFPRLVTSEPQVYAEFRGREDAILNGSAWVEKDRGMARMPIAEAMRIVGERGTLPVFAPAATPTPGPAATREGGVR